MGDLGVPDGAESTLMLEENVGGAEGSELWDDFSDEPLGRFWWVRPK
jgi:hypothetical protein